jgi:YARHG domain
MGGPQLDLQGERLCFRTPKAIEAFGNAGCRYDDVARVPLNDIERHNMTTIKSVEIKKGC